MSGRLKALVSIHSRRGEKGGGEGNLKFVGLGVKNKECAGKSALLGRFWEEGGIGRGTGGSGESRNPVGGDFSVSLLG